MSYNKNFTIKYSSIVSSFLFLVPVPTKLKLQRDQSNVLLPNISVFAAPINLFPPPFHIVASYSKYENTPLHTPNKEKSNRFIIFRLEHTIYYPASPWEQRIEIDKHVNSACLKSLGHNDTKLFVFRGTLSLSLAKLCIFY